MIGKRIAEARSSLDGRRVTQAELAAHLGVSPQAVSGWERGEADPEPDKIATIASFLKISIGWLLDGKGPMRGPSFGARDAEYLALFHGVPESIQNSILEILRHHSKP